MPPVHLSRRSFVVNKSQPFLVSSQIYQPTSDNILEKFLFLHHKPPTATTPTVAGPHSHHCFLLFILLSLFSFTLTLSLFTTQTTTTATPPPSNNPLHTPVFNALLHYAGTTPNSTNSSRMSASELTSIATVLRRCSSAACNLLVFGPLVKILRLNLLQGSYGGYGSGYCDDDGGPDGGSGVTMMCKTPYIRDNNVHCLKCKKFIQVATS
ncbi:hypothetical protein QVD17_05695 [Tagetes erecta]|uniref:Uncharacterized protein n=1 Tax=Tagetes erecta TaxID=13708 RepID=A0AAD8LEU4_TARER|nr:hypothetical protein QVD17_05695 [Tagetes erecta]